MSGKEIAQEVKTRIRADIEACAVTKPVLATILVGDNPASKTYLKNKHASCSEVGIGSKNIELPAGTSQEELESLLQSLSSDRSVTGILLQLPLPKGLNDVSAIAAISPNKDVDGLHPYNLGLLLQNAADLVPCTPKGVIVMLRYYGIEIRSRDVVVVNRSKLVGRPLLQLLLNNDATVTVCHSKTKNLHQICRGADILITGIGRRAEFTVTADMVKPGAAVVDVGTSIIQGKVKGDVDFEQVSTVAGYISPVPGGVGPMTIAMLLYNTMLAAYRSVGRQPNFKPEELRARATQ
jgi:methylenetetrahydrofolate dehydrogenase (NADP+)/methenyltetrahydrofolate cyclohydrolase